MWRISFVDRRIQCAGTSACRVRKRQVSIQDRQCPGRCIAQSETFLLYSSSSAQPVEPAIDGGRKQCKTVRKRAGLQIFLCRTGANPGWEGSSLIPPRIADTSSHGRNNYQSGQKSEKSYIKYEFNFLQYPSFDNNLPICDRTFIYLYGTQGVKND
jgi:hypothetical protein